MVWSSGMVDFTLRIADVQVTDLADQMAASAVPFKRSFQRNEHTHSLPMLPCKSEGPSVERSTATFLYERRRAEAQRDFTPWSGNPPRLGWVGKLELTEALRSQDRN